MNKNIDEVFAEFEKFVEPAIDKGFDDGSRTGEKGQAAYRNRLGWREDLKDFLTTALKEQERKIKEDIAAKIDELTARKYSTLGRTREILNEVKSLLTPLPSSTEE